MESDLVVVRLLARREMLSRLIKTCSTCIDTTIAVGISIHTLRFKFWSWGQLNSNQLFALNLNDNSQSTNNNLNLRFKIYKKCTMVTLKSLTPPRRFGHWAKWKIPLIAKWRGKSEMVEKKEKVGQLCPSTETGRFRAGLWSTAGANCTHLIKQSTTASSRNNSSLPKYIPE